MYLGVIYIGDRAVGKTHLAMELANPNRHYVKVTEPDYEYLKALLSYDEASQSIQEATKASQSLYSRFLEIQVQLPTGNKQITLDWIDTPGEIWRKGWQEKNQGEWQKFLTTLQKSTGILLILPPYRELIKSGVNAEDYMTQQQWCNRFESWVQFFRTDCPKIRHLLICLNKADLFCEIEAEASKLAYIPHRSPMNWQQRDSYVTQRYFRGIQSQLRQLNQSISGLSVRCFITSIKNRHLLELPWIYLGTFLESEF